MKKTVIILALFASYLSMGQNAFQDLYYGLLAQQGNSAIQEALIDSFFLAYPETPYTSGDSAVFLYRGTASVQVAGDHTGWDPNGNDLFPIAGSSLRYRYGSFEPTARLDYKLVVNGNWLLDPKNPNTAPGGFGSNSELAMPDYVQPWEIVYNPAVQAGTMETRSITSTNTGNAYPVHVYLPPNYDSTLQYPTVYFQDGSEYRLLASAPTVLDNLIHVDSIQPVIGVFVTPTNRNEEYAFSLRDEYTDFFVNELVPFIDGEYATNPVAYARLVLGDSFGGNISALIAFQHNDIFGNVGFHSGAFWPDNFHTLSVIAQSNIDSINVAMVWGTYESAKLYNRTLRDSLIGAGIPVRWSEYHEGHSWGLWRATLDELVGFAFPASALSQIDVPIPTFLRLYPNPFQDDLTLSFEAFVPDDTFEFLLYSSKGQVVYSDTLRINASNMHHIDLSRLGLTAGFYFAEIRWNGGQSKTYKLKKN